MKFIYLCLALIMVFCMIFSTGCIPVVPDEPDPDPILVMSIDANVINWNEDCIMYTVENDGDLDVHYYKLAFSVEFNGKGHTPMVLYADSLGLFEVDAKVTKCVDIICPYVDDCPYFGLYEVKSVEVEVLDLW